MVSTSIDFISLIKCQTNHLKNHMRSIESEKFADVFIQRLLWLLVRYDLRLCFCRDGIGIYGLDTINKLTNNNVM
jgi:hypothetical protein